MKSFEYVNAATKAGSIKLLGTDGRARPLSGGTDLLTELKLRIIEPERLVNLKTIPGLDNIQFDEANGLRIGALATLSSIAAHQAVRKRYRALFQAISQAASPQLRNRGTIGGNLNQASRCWYYRGQFHCWLKGGNICFAKDGENYHHALFGGGPCYTAYASDPPTALVALEANVHLTGLQGERTLHLDKFFLKPQADVRRLTVIQPSEIVTEIQIPSPANASRGIFLKAMDRQTWAFALVSIAAQIDFDRDVVKDARIVLGGVAPIPWRLQEVESSIRGQILDAAVIDRAAELAVNQAQPLSHNKYKIPLIKGIVKEALAGLKK